MPIALKRIYDKEVADGKRILIDRLWPSQLSAQHTKIFRRTVFPF